MTTETTDNTAAPAGQSAQQPTTDGANSGQSNGANFTQADIDKIVGRTRKEARDTAVADLLKELGLTSKDEVKSTIEAARKAKESEMTETQRIQAALEKATQQIATLQAERDTERQSRRQDKIAAHMERAATALKANDAETVLLYLKEKHGAALSDIMAEDGTIDEKKVAALMDKVKAEKPIYFTPITATPGSQSNFGGRTTPDKTRLLEAAQRDQRRQIKSGF